MKRMIIAAACLGLTACGTTGTKVLENLQGCERHYAGNISGGALGADFNGTIKVDCLPAKAEIPVPEIQ
jgi:hypothetical protein